MDELDIAGELEQRERDASIARQLQKSRQPSRSDCLDCGDAIEANRKVLGGVLRCLECEGYHQQEQRQRGFA